MTVGNLLLALVSIIAIILIVAVLACWFFSIPLIEQDMQKGELSEDDLKLIEDAAKAANIPTVRYTVRSSVVIHRVWNDGTKTTYWNPLDPKTGHHFDILLRAPKISLAFKNTDGANAMCAVAGAPCIDDYKFSPSEQVVTPEICCRVICTAAAHFYNSTQERA